MVSGEGLRRLEGRLFGLKVRVREYRKELGVSFRRKNKAWLVCLDVLMVLCVVFNMGALVTTNLLVAKAEVERTGEKPVFVEANPVTERTHGYEGVRESEERKAASRFLVGFGIAGVVWGLMGAYYLWLRSKVATTKDLFVLSFVVIAWWSTFGLDFANNLGYAIGVFGSGIL